MQCFLREYRRPSRTIVLKLQMSGMPGNHAALRPERGACENFASGDAVPTQDFRDVAENRSRCASVGPTSHHGKWRGQARARRLERITVAERESLDGRPGLPGVARDDRAGRDARGYGGERVPIGERVRQAHLEHFCPGGAGLPVTGSGPIGLSWVEADPAEWEANAARAAGQRCGRCGRAVTPRQDARKRACGTWVHETCPS